VIEETTMPSATKTRIALILALALLRGGFSFAEEPPLLTKVASRPGAAAWSPDGARLAVIQEQTLVLVDVRTTKHHVLPIPHPSFVSWAPGTEMLVIATEDHRLLRVNPDTGASTTVDLPGTPAGAQWLVADTTMLVVTAQSRTMSIGTPAEAHMLTIEPGPPKEVFRWDSMLPTRNPDIDFTTGWVHARPNPLDDTLIVPEFHKPPQFPAYLLFRAVDPYTGDVEDLFRLETKRFTGAGDWSPDGRRLALADDDGNLLMWSQGQTEATTTAESTPSGIYPSWNPKFDLLYLGGHILKGDGNLHRRLVDDSQAIGFWSPDGTRLALVSQGALTIVSDIDGALLTGNPSNTRTKIRTLARLLHEDLISEEDYRARRNRLRAAKGQ
jgi:hypothetical protein